MLPKILSGIKTSAFDRLVEFEKNVGKRFLKHEAAIASVRARFEKRSELHADFKETPTPEKLERLILLQVSLNTAEQIFFSLHNELEGEKAAAMGEAQELLREAYREMRDGIDARRLAVTREDQARSEASGIDIVSDAIFARLDHLEQSLRDGECSIVTNFYAAWSMLKGVASEHPKPRRMRDDILSHPVEPEKQRAYALNGG